MTDRNKQTKNGRKEGRKEERKKEKKKESNYYFNNLLMPLFQLEIPTPTYWILAVK